LPAPNREKLRIRGYRNPGQSYKSVDVKPCRREKQEIEQAVAQRLAHSSRVRLDGNCGHERNGMQKKRDAAEIGKARRRMENELAVRTRKRSDQPQSAASSHQNPECVCAAVRCVCIRKETRIGPERQQAHENVAERRLHCAMREQ